MVTSRRIDDRELLMKRQQKIFFQISGAGHEAVNVAAGMARAGKRVLLVDLDPQSHATMHVGIDPVMLGNLRMHPEKHRFCDLR